MSIFLDPVFVGNAGLRLADTNASHHLIVSPGSNLTADRTLTITTGDADRTLTISADATISGTNTGDQTSVTGNAGTATALATARAIYGNNFDGTAALTQIIASTYGGTGNGFAKFSGPASTEKTFTLPNATCTILTTNDAVTNAQLSDMAQSTIKGRAAGAGTGDPTDLTATQATAILDAFVAAGGSHAKGLVPDPGATAFTNHPRLLGSQAAFVVPSGKVLAYNYVATDESTNSTTHTDLTTPDSITFDLDDTRDVLIVWNANGYSDTNSNGLIDQLEFNGTDDTATATSYTFTTANFGATISIMYSKSLGAGSHTVKCQHRRLVGGNAHWRNRTLMAILRA